MCGGQHLSRLSELPETILVTRASRSHAIGFYTRIYRAVIRVYDAGWNVIETHEHKGDFKEW